MLVHFRHKTSFFGRTLLGILMFVWISMAIAPCVMANELAAFDTDISISVVHEKMDNCAYCPEVMNGMADFTLCQHHQGYTPDNLVQAAASIDAESFVLFELPVAPVLLHTLMMMGPAGLERTSDVTFLSPLILTGILRI